MPDDLVSEKSKTDSGLSRYARKTVACFVEIDLDSDNCSTMFTL